MSTSSQPAVLQEIIARLMTDAAFRDRALADVRGTLAAEGYELDEATLARLEAQGAQAQKLGLGDRFDAEMLKRPEFGA